MQDLEDVIANQQATEELWRGIHAHTATLVERWEPMLTPEVVSEIEQKLEADEDDDLTPDEWEQWQVAIEVSRPTPRFHTDEDGLRQMDDDSDAELDAWNDRSIAETLSTRLPRDSVLNRPTPMQRARAAPVAAHHRGTSRAVRSRGGSRSKGTSRGDPDPEPPLTRLQLWRLAVSEAVRARVEQIGDRCECTSCTRYLPRGEFRPGRLVCTSCEVDARIQRRQRRAVAA